MAARTEVPTRAGAAALDAILAAALLLPGVAGLAQAQDVEDAVSLQAARHREGARAIGVDGGHGTPLTVQTLTARGSIGSGRDRLDITSTQDSWSGATPVATAPAVAQGNRPVRRATAGGLVTVGASPMLNGSLLLDAADRPVQRDPATGRVQAAAQLVHTLSTASPETRRQLDVKLTRRLDDGSFALGGGVSVERDHRSRFVNAAWRLDRDTTSLTFGGSATASTIEAALDHDAAPYITKNAYADRLTYRAGQTWLTGTRRDLSATAAWTQVLSPTAQGQATLVHTRSAGLLAHPYKVTSVIYAPAAVASGGDADGVRGGDLRALMEQRPERRAQWSADGRLVLHQAPHDAALHLAAGVSSDDWGVRARHAEAEWFRPLAEGQLLSLRLRATSQQAARFYTPYLVTRQPYRQIVTGADGRVTLIPYDATQLPAFFTSDVRLAALGTLTAGLGWTKRLAADLRLDLSLDRTLQSGRWAWGGNGLGRWADLRSTLVQATLTVDLDGTSARNAGVAADAHAGHGPAHGSTHAPMPAELLPAHGPLARGQWMVGLRLHTMGSGGALRSGTQALPAADAVARACGGAPCLVQPTAMSMHMQMLDLMVGLGGGWTLMLMPQHVSMSMDTVLAPGAVAGDTPVHIGRHESAGLGDTALHALWSTPASAGGSRWQLGLGLGLPTGSASLAHRRMHQQDGVPMDAGMQTGTGTTDLLPSLTVQGESGALAWGAQATAALRLSSRNADGYAWSPRADASGWLGWPLAHGLSATARMAWRLAPRVVGTRTPPVPALSPPDDPSNHGGRQIDAGIGLAAHGAAGTLSMEIVQPLWARLRGVQLTPRARVSLAWSRAL